MSREIKLRLWKKSVKKYLDFVTVTMGSDGKLTGVASSSTLEPNLSKDDYTLEQYTGLKDKNGKEIYEGDIINTCCGKAKVYFDEESCSYKIWMKHGSTMPLIGKKSHRHLEYEVIGNIHEPIDESNQV